MLAGFLSSSFIRHMTILSLVRCVVYRPTDFNGWLPAGRFPSSTRAHVIAFLVSYFTHLRPVQ